MIDVTTSDGKYRYVQDDKGQVVVYRNGEPWFSSGVEHNNLLRAFAQDLAVARNELLALREAVKPFARIANLPGMNELFSDDYQPMGLDILPFLSDYRRAARALQSHSTGDDPK